jgi:hypothetical protein
MAERQEEEQKRTRLNGGMFRGTSPLDQPGGTVRHARNAHLNTPLGAWSNEGGATLFTDLPQNSIVVGRITLSDNRMVLFLSILNRSEIGLWDSGSYTTLYNPNIQSNTDLLFSPDHPITGTFRDQADGDLMVYWTDNVNPPRALNVTRQLQSNTSQRLYGIDPNLTPDTEHRGRLNLFPHAGPVPHIALNGVTSGGGCKTGSHYLVLGYRDHDLIQTNHVTVSNPVPIVDEPEGVSPIESYDGAPPDILTGKSIIWNVSNLNTDMQYLCPTVISLINGVLTAYELKDLAIDGPTMTVAFTGPQTAITSSPEEVLIDNVEYRTARTMEQLDNILYLGNLTSNTDIGYQPYANYITAKACVHPLYDNQDGFDPFYITDDFLSRKSSPNMVIKNGYRDPKNVFYLKGYTRDEVYAFYIAFILKSGQMSFAYHIPGRPALENVPVSQIETLNADYPNSQLNRQFVNEGETLYGQQIDNWDIINLTGTQNAQGYMYQWYDFSHLVSLGSKNMNFWKNLNEFYPDTDNYLVINAQSPNAPVGDLRNDNVRHHRFPGNSNREFTTVESSNAGEMDIQSKSRAVVRWFWFRDVERDALTDSKFTIHDPYPGTDWQGARSHAGGALGGGGFLHDSDIEDAFTNTAFTSCRPDLNTRFLNNIAGITGAFEDFPFSLTDQGRPWEEYSLGCGQTSDDVEFIYDTKIPNNVSQVFVAWDFPFGNFAADCGVGASPGGPGVPHCFGAFTANVLGVTSNTIQVYSPNNCNIWHPRSAFGTDRGGFVAWIECESILLNDPANTLRQDVQALGICFDNIKVPKAIADQAQGFRIYYAKRTHENRTIIGQAPAHPMSDKYRVDPSGCDGSGKNIGLIDYWLPGGIPAPTGMATSPFDSTVFSFHDFYLLNRTPSLAQATHMRLQYIMGMFSFDGPTRYYVDGIETDTTLSGLTPGTFPGPSADIYSCFKPQVITSFHLSGEHFLTQDVYGSNILNFLLKDKSRAYVLGNTINEAAGSGFELPIYNIGGHTHVALKTQRFLPYLPSGAQASWRQQRSDRANIRFSRYSNSRTDNETQLKGLMLHMVNLHAFKTDVYSPTDQQPLVWTGFEVVGERFKDFIVGEDLRSPNPTGTLPAFTTGPVFGGDTFICRYGYRMTHREEVSEVPFSFPNSGSIDHKSVIMTIVESTENINFRHVEKDLPYFPGDSLPNVLKVKADVDLTYNPDPLTGNIRYNEDYSAVNDLKAVLPLPFYLEQPEKFPVRVVRSNRASASFLQDNFRYWAANETRDLNNRYGQLIKISAMNNRLLFHMEDSLFITKGKQRMKTSEGEDAFVGSGDIFTQDPDIILHTDSGHLGTRSLYSALVTPEGYFFVDELNRRVMLAQDSAEDLSAEKYGMDQWFDENLPYALEQYGYTPQDRSFITGMGFHAVWDQGFERVILTKRDLRPTEVFINLYKGNFNRLSSVPNNIQTGIVSVNGDLWYKVFPQATWTLLEVEEDTQSPINKGPGDISRPLFERTGWTISFKFAQSQNMKGAWESFHDYVPYMYSYAGTDLFSFNDGTTGMFKHGDTSAFGEFYGTRYPFEIEAVINTPGTYDLLFHAFSYLTEVYDVDPLTSRYREENHAGFTSAIAYTSDHLTGEFPLEYLINIRRVGSEWRVNQLRDLSKRQVSTSAYYTGPFTQSNHGRTGMSATGAFNQGTERGTMDAFFLYDGMYSPVNPNATDNSTQWYLQSKMTGRYMGIRLIADNAENKSVNLYSVLADFRPYRK